MRRRLSGSSRIRWTRFGHARRVITARFVAPSFGFGLCMLSTSARVLAVRIRILGISVRVAVIWVLSVCVRIGIIWVLGVRVRIGIIWVLGVSVRIRVIAGVAHSGYGIDTPSTYRLVTLFYGSL